MSLNVKKMIEQDLNAKRVLIREDLNVPIQDGNITSDARIRASLPTIKHALEAGAAVMLMSHLGRPVEGASAADNAEFSLAPVAAHLTKALGQEVKLITDWINGVDVAAGEVVLLENVRFNVGEEKSDEALSKKMAALCDIYVMDAFGTAHRAQASTYGVGLYAPIACAGPLLVNELEALGKALTNPERPFVAVVGGSKVSTKLTVLDALSSKVDQLIVGGGISNTFVAAAGHNVGKSLFEKDLIPEAKRLQAKLDIPVAQDVRVTTDDFSPAARATVKASNTVTDDEEIMDYGDEMIATVTDILKNAKTIIWNGPVGVFEFPNFRAGTEAVGRAIAASNAFSIAGGGDTLAAIDMFGLENDISYISTGGGAFLEFVEGKVLPAVEMLEKRA